MSFAILRLYSAFLDDTMLTLHAAAESVTRPRLPHLASPPCFRAQSQLSLAVSRLSNTWTGITKRCTTGRAIFRDSGNVAEIVRKGFLSGGFPAHFSGPEIYTFRYLSHLFPMSGEAKFQLVGNCT